MYYRMIVFIFVEFKIATTLMHDRVRLRIVRSSSEGFGLISSGIRPGQPSSTSKTAQFVLDYSSQYIGLIMRVIPPFIYLFMYSHVFIDVKLYFYTCIDFTYSESTLIDSRKETLSLVVGHLS